MEQATKYLLEDFGFADENELINWSQTFVFDVRWHYEPEDDLKNFGGWPRMLVTDGDGGISLFTTDEDETIGIEHIGCSYCNIEWEYIDNFRLAIDESDRDWEECLQEDQTEFFLIEGQNVSHETQ